MRREFATNAYSTHLPSLCRLLVQLTIFLQEVTSMLGLQMRFYCIGHLPNHNPFTAINQFDSIAAVFRAGLLGSYGYVKIGAEYDWFVCAAHTEG